MSRATTPFGKAVRGVVAAAILGSALLLGGCIVVPGPGYYRPGWHYWR